VARPATTPFARAVNRALADALVVEIHRCRLGRRETAQRCGIARSYLQRMLAAKVHPSVGVLISIAEGLGIPPEQLLAKTMQNLNRIRASALPPVDPPL